MASSVTDSAANAARTVANRAESVLGDDAREAVRRGKSFVRSFRPDYRFITTGSMAPSKAKKRTPARKSGR
jgi:hypothetical protein